jgi:hypothetical protein
MDDDNCLLFYLLFVPWFHPRALPEGQKRKVAERKPNFVLGENDRFDG